MEGSNLTILCTSNNASGIVNVFAVNGQYLSLYPMVDGNEARFTVGRVSRTDDGNVYKCFDTADRSSVTSDPLNVLCEYISLFRCLLNYLFLFRNSMQCFYASCRI